PLPLRPRLQVTRFPRCDLPVEGSAMFKLRTSQLGLTVLLSATSCSLLLEVPDDPENTPTLENIGGQSSDVKEASGGQRAVINKPASTGGDSSLGGETGSGGETASGGEDPVGS